MRLTCESHSSPVLTASDGPNLAVHGETGDHDALAGSGSGVGGTGGGPGAGLAAKIRQLPQMTARRSVSYKRKQDWELLVQDQPSAGPPGEVRGRLIQSAIPRSSAATFGSGQWNATENLFVVKGRFTH